MLKRDLEAVESAKSKKLQDCNKTEFRELILDILLEDVDYFHKGDLGSHLGLDIYAFTDYLQSREPDVVYSAKKTFADLRPEVKKRINRAADELAKELLSTKEFVFLTRLLQISNYMEGLVNSEIGMEFVQNTSLPDDLRVAAAVSMLNRDFANAVPFKFWQGLDVRTTPSLLYPVLREYIQQDKTFETLHFLESVVEPKELTGIKIIVGEWLKDLSRSINGLKVVLEASPKLPVWVRNLFSDLAHHIRDEAKRQQFCEGLSAVSSK